MVMGASAALVYRARREAVSTLAEATPEPMKTRRIVRVAGRLIGQPGLVLTARNTSAK
jgi:hypothetical protein